MVLNIFFLPLLGFVTALGFGKFLGRRGVSIVTTSLIGVCCFLSAAAFGRFIGEKGASLITVSSIVLTFMISCFGFYEIGLCGSSVYVDL